MPAYLQLCMDTWARYLGDYEIVVLNHANLDRWITPGTYDFTALKKLPLGVQKDAILAALLCAHGGVFMDVDTIATGDITLILQRLRRAEMILFDLHLGFAAARPGARVLRQWIPRAQRRLEQLNVGDAVTASWDYVGNAPLSEVMEEMTRLSMLGRFYERIQRRKTKWPRVASTFWSRAIEPVWARRKGLFFRTVYRKYLTMLDRRKYGFMAELAHYGTNGIGHMEDYRKFWFEEKLDIDHVFRRRQMLIGLHHSWTPDWYKSLTKKQVLENDCLLSKTLRAVLEK
jgi:Capsular polysaccharide synthesis protein